MYAGLLVGVALPDTSDDLPGLEAEVEPEPFGFGKIRKGLRPREHASER